MIEKIDSICFRGRGIPSHTENVIWHRVFNLTQSVWSWHDWHITAFVWANYFSNKVPEILFLPSFQAYKQYRKGDVNC